MSTRNIISPSDQQVLQNAIHQAELNTSGEIRLHIDRHCRGEVLQNAWKVFRALGMHKTKERNAVLIYVAYDDHKLAIIGDQGIHSKVGETYWDAIKDTLLADFKEGAFLIGLSRAIERVGGSLKDLFPYQSDDVNELSNEISFGTDNTKKNS